MVQDGYAAVSSRRIAEEAGVTPGLVHYYFPTLDDLFLAVLRRRAEHNQKRQEQLLQDAQPLRALWAFHSEPQGAALLCEFMALANHRKAIGEEIARHAENFRRLQLRALSAHLEDSDLDTERIPPAALLLLMDSLSQKLVQERSIGMRTGLPEAVALVERTLEFLEGPPKDAPRRRRGAKG